MSRREDVAPLHLRIRHHGEALAQIILASCADQPFRLRLGMTGDAIAVAEELLDLADELEAAEAAKPRPRRIGYTWRWFTRWMWTKL